MAKHLRRMWGKASSLWVERLRVGGCGLRVIEVCTGVCRNVDRPGDRRQGLLKVIMVLICAS
jgi:hypothetical protein